MPSEVEPRPPVSGALSPVSKVSFSGIDANVLLGGDAAPFTVMDMTVAPGLLAQIGVISAVSCTLPDSFPSTGISKRCALCKSRSNIAVVNAVSSAKELSLAQICPTLRIHVKKTLIKSVCSATIRMTD